MSDTNASSTENTPASAPASAKASHRSRLSAAGLVIIAILFVAVVVLSQTLFRSDRIDLTEHQLFTLADGTKEVVQSIDEPITLRFYFSSRLSREIPAIGNYAQRVRDLLEEIAAESDGNIKLEIHDPKPFTDDEDRAVAFGLQGVPVDQSGEVVYFGLAGTNSVDQQEVIPFFDQSRERFLEYDIVRAISNLASPEKPKLALLSSLPISGSEYARQVPNAPKDSWVAYDQLTENFDVSALTADMKAVPDDIDVVVLVHPKNLSEDTLYALDQFVMRGGKLLAFVDPHSEADATRPQPGRMAQPGAPAGSSINRLTRAWGVTVPEDEVVGDLASARRVQVPDQSGSRVAAIDYPLWLGVTPPNFTAGDPVTSDLNVVTMASPGHIVVADDAAATVAPLMTTSEQGGIVPVEEVRQGSSAILKISNEFKPTGSYPLAARLTGSVPSAFPDGPPEPAAVREARAALEAAGDDDERAKRQAALDKALADAEKNPDERAARHLATSQKPLNAILVADVDMLADGLWVQVRDFFGQRVTIPSANNGAFFINAADNLTGSGALIGLRARGVGQRPFTLIQDIQRDAERQFRAKEQSLLTRLQETEQKLKALQQENGGGSGGTMVLTDEQRAEIERFRKQSLATRRELRDVQFALREDVENLNARVRWINIAAVPLLVALIAILVAILRRRRRSRHHAAYAA